MSRSSTRSGILCAISFFSIIPARCQSFDRAMPLWFFVPALINGAVASAAYFILFTTGGPLLASAGAVAAILLMSGFNHLDGVLDTGDALMFRGSTERRKEILKDHYLGAGGFGSAFIIYLLFFAALTTFNRNTGVAAIIISEVLTKTAYMIGLRIGKPLFQEGLFVSFQKLMASQDTAIYVNILLLFIISLFTWWIFLLGVAVAILAYVFTILRLDRTFGGTNGDILGFSGEIARVIFLVVSAMLPYAFFHLLAVA
ncbi:MAG: adenosylcobinamide-GDP ribazoletransferase [Thermoplasmataceae archaeon]